MTRLLDRLLDEDEFLSPHGIRSLSAAHRDGLTIDIAGMSMSMPTTPGESDTGLFGGNSNWRGPVWFPLNVLLIDALRTYAAGSAAGGDGGVPDGVGERLALHEVAQRLEDRLSACSARGPTGVVPATRGTC